MEKRGKRNSMCRGQRADGVDPGGVCAEALG